MTARRRHGFTMLEAMVALAIIGTVCVATLGAYAGSLRATVAAAERLPLTVLAEERLAALDLHDGPLVPLADSVARGTFAAPYGSAAWSIETRDVRGTAGLYDVALTVTDGDDRLRVATRRYRPRPRTAGGAP